MRPAVSFLYTATVLSTLGQALSFWGHSKPLSLQERASIWGLPDCASTCVTSSFGGCNSIDVECICKNRVFLDNLGCCMSKACDKADQDGWRLPTQNSLLSKLMSFSCHRVCKQLLFCVQSQRSAHRCDVQVDRCSQDHR